jgi:hypothetical protein
MREDMSENKRIGSRPAPYMKTENNGMFSSPGPFIGIIKNNIDPTCAGRLQVYIPQHGGPNENDPGNWLTVSYASPFRGQTRQRTDLTSYIDGQLLPTTNDGELQENSFQSYGFWFVPPDLNGRVLCFFAQGDPSQGYWTSCIQDSMDAHMVPAIGAVPAAKTNSPGGGGYIWQPADNPENAPEIPNHTMLEKYIQISGNGQKEIPYRLPVSEPVITNQATSNPSTPLQVLMVPQVFQTLQLGLQGLAFDFIRGTTSASSVRENPSQVFGISTPGRLTSFANAALSQNIINQLTSFINSGQATGSAQGQSLAKSMGCAYRTGGHQFVMDDGSVTGQDQGIRIRTTGGNEILMDDTNGQIYVINGPGTAWLELSPSGYIDVFSAKGFSVRSQGDINFHSDQNINFNAGGKIQVHSAGDIQIDGGGRFTARSTSGATIYDTAGMQLGTGGSLTVSAKKGDFNTGSEFSVQAAAISLPGKAGIVKDPGALQLNKQIEVTKQSGSQVWWQTGTFKSITSRAPAHEPWPDHEINGIKTANVPQGNALGTPIERPASGSTSSGVRGTQVGHSVNEAEIKQQPPTGNIHCSSGKIVLSNIQTQALFAQIGKRESGNNYASAPGTGHAACGKYQFEPSSLQNNQKQGGGYLKKPGNTGNAQDWTGFHGINSLSDWLSNGTEQENAMMLYTQWHFDQLQQAGILSCSSTPEDIGGYLMAEHLVGLDGAILLFHTRNNSDTSGDRGLSADGNGTTAASYYVLGSTAVHTGTQV